MFFSVQKAHGDSKLAWNRGSKTCLCCMHRPVVLQSFGHLKSIWMLSKFRLPTKRYARRKASSHWYCLNHSFREHTVEQHLRNIYTSTTSTTSILELENQHSPDLALGQKLRRWADEQCQAVDEQRLQHVATAEQLDGESQDSDYIAEESNVSSLWQQCLGAFP